MGYHGMLYTVIRGISYFYMTGSGTMKFSVIISESQIYHNQTFTAILEGM